MGSRKVMRKTSVKRQCEFTKDTGERCRARPLSDSKFCFFHDPNKSEEQKVARRKGGYARRSPTLPKNIPEFELKVAEDVVRLLSITINQVRRGEIDPRVANAVGYLSGIILKAKEQGDIEKRLKQIEEIVLKGGPQNVASLYT